MVCGGVWLLSGVASAVKVMLAGAPNWVLVAGAVSVTVGGVATLMVLAVETLLPPRLSVALAVKV